MSSLGRESDHSGKSFLPGHVQPLALGPSSQLTPSCQFPPPILQEAERFQCFYGASSCLLS